MQFTLRKYHPEDFLTLWEIDQACFPPGISYTQYELASYIRRTKAITLVAEIQTTEDMETSEGRRPEHQQILGFLVAERFRGSGHIITIDVRQEARRLRVGTALLDAAEDQLRLWNCQTVRLETAVDNVSALSFYKRHGYNVIKVVPRYYSNGVDAFLLEKHLLSPHPSR